MAGKVEMHSIRVKLTAITIAAIVITVLALGSAGVYFVSEESEQNSTTILNLLSDDAKKTLDGFLSVQEQSVETVANQTADVFATDGRGSIAVIPRDQRTPYQAKQLDAFLNDYYNLARQTFGSIANHADGVVTYYYCINPEVGNPDDGFFYSRVGSDTYKKQENLDARTFDPDDMEHYTWYYTPIERGEACWVGPYKAHFLDEVWTVSFVMPIYQDDALLGVLGMDILLDEMESQINAFEVYDTGFACLTDGEGRILAHPDYEIGDVPQVEGQVVNAELFAGDTSAGSAIRYKVDGVERQAAYSTLVNGMKIVVVAPVREITASQRHLIQNIALFAVIILVAFATLTFVIVRTLTMPLEHLTAASRKLAAGDYDVELSYEGKDEVGVLTNSFRQMRDHLKHYIGDLNTRVSTDALTGVKNKGAFDAATLELDEAIGIGSPEFAIIMFDCNSLKLVNDEHGHDRGDLYLQKASSTICEVFEHSPVFRVGGDEFAVLLQGHDYEHRDELMRVFDQRVAQINGDAETPWDKVDISVGMALYQPGVHANVDQVLRNADELMYLDKKLSKQARADQEAFD